MLVLQRHLFISFLTLFVFVVLGCDSGGGGSDGDDSGESALVPGSVTERGATLCGVVVKGDLVNPPDTAEATPVTLVRTIDSNLVEVAADGQSMLVKLHALGATTGFTNTAAQALYSSISASGSLFYFSAGRCTEQTVAGEAEVGQIVTADGMSFSEQALEQHVAGVVETSGSCGVSSLTSCYTALSDPGSVSAPGAGSAEKKQIGDFLWKPHSESAYNPGGLSILLNPCNARVVVNSQELVDYPSGNGRCVTVRSGSSGCSFGSNIKVEVFDRTSGAPIYFGDSPSLTIGNGCDRTEFGGVGSSGSEDSGSETVACSTMSADVSYSPAHESCAGNAAVTLRGEFASAFSVQLRLPDGGDRLDEACGEAICSPYKVQRYLDGDGVKTACFGAPGNANLMEEVAHTSIKMAGDDSDPDRFCIPDPTIAVN